MNKQYDFCKLNDTFRDEILSFISPKEEQLNKEGNSEKRSFLKLLKEKNKIKANSEKNKKRNKRSLEQYINEKNKAKKKRRENVKKDAREAEEINPLEMSVHDQIKYLNDFHSGKTSGTVVRSNQNEQKFPNSFNVFKKPKKKYMPIGAGFKDIMFDLTNNNDEFYKLINKKSKTVTNEDIEQSEDYEQHGYEKDVEDDNLEKNYISQELNWITTFLESQEKMRKSPDYQFLYCLAGATNTVIDRLYTIEDISSKYSQAKLLNQQKIDAVKMLTGKVKNIYREISDLETKKSKQEHDIDNLHMFVKDLSFLHQQYMQLQSLRKNILKYYIQYKISQKVFNILTKNDTKPNYELRSDSKGQDSEELVPVSNEKVKFNKFLKKIIQQKKFFVLLNNFKYQNWDNEIYYLKSKDYSEE